MQNVTTAMMALNSGAAIPALGMGTVDKEASDDAAVAALVYGLEVGYRCLDTASVYKNEHVIGRAIRESAVPREEVFVTTKVWNADVRADRVEAAFEESLRTLGLDYVDLYLVHWPIVERLIPSWQAMEKILAGGRARAIGVSNFLPHHLDAILAEAGVVPALNQVEFHPMFQQHPLRDYCDAKGIRIQAWKPFFGGKLFGNSTFADLARKYNVSEGQIILRWAYQEGIATIPKSGRPDRIRENANIFGFSLDADDMEEMRKLDTGHRLGSDPDNFTF